MGKELEKLELLEECTTPVGKYSFYDRIVIAKINSDIHLKFKDAGPILEKCRVHYPDEGFIYITHRVNSYSVEPLEYKDMEGIPNLIGLAVVGPTHEKQKNAEIERQFFSTPFAILDTLDAALVWAKSLFKESSLDWPQTFSF